MNRPVVYMGDHTILTRLLYGPKIYVDTRDVSVAGHLILDGYWEDWVTNVFLSVVKPGMTVLDIGANCGYYSLLAANAVGPKGTVHAFEPNPFHHANLFKSKVINGYQQLHLHKAALSDQEGELTLFCPTVFSGSATIHPLQSSDAAIDPVLEVRVPAVNLGNYLPGLQADVIKIDIEGAEPLVLNSIVDCLGGGTKGRESHLFMEFNHAAWTNQGYDAEAIFTHLVALGFDIYVIESNSSLKSVSPKELVHRTSANTHLDLYLKFGRKIG